MVKKNNDILNSPEYLNLSAELDKLKEENNNLKEMAKLATQRITELENEKDNKPSKKIITAKPIKKEIIKDNKPIERDEHWIAFSKFASEENFLKAKEYFSQLFKKNWNYNQRQAIYKMIRATEENLKWAKGKWGQHFNN